MERPGQVGGVEEPEQPERTEGERSDRDPGPQPRPAVERDRGAGEDQRHHHHHAHRGTDQVVTEEAVLVDVDQEPAALGQRPTGLARLHAATLHRVGSVEPEVGEDGGRDVGEVHEAVVLRRGGAQQAGLQPRGAHRSHAERVALPAAASAP